MKFSSNNLTLSYNATHNPEPSSESDGPQERAGPHPEVGQKGICPSDARMGQARRQTEGHQWKRSKARSAIIYKRGCDKKGPDPSCSNCGNERLYGGYWYKFTWLGKGVHGW
jgi:hypothetical protein